MNKLFAEFENENSLRSYPFASGCTTKDYSGVGIGTGVLVDAALYPVNPTGCLYLSKIGTDGVVSISDDKSVVMTAEVVPGESVLEFYDLSDLHRHVGTVVAASADALAVLANVYEDRRFRPESTRFASSCVFPIVNDGVTSVNVGGTGAADGYVAFLNGGEDQVRVSTDEHGSTLRFDVIPQPAEIRLGSIKHIYCIVDGKTPFRIMKMQLSGGDPSTGNTVAVYLDNIDRQDVCSSAHREDSLVMKDTCDCGPDHCHDPVDPVDIPEVYQVEAVDIPHGADGAFYLVVPNMTGYDNPLSITLKDGMVIPKREIDVDENSDNLGEFVDSTTAKGVVLQVPGLAVRND